MNFQNLRISAKLWLAVGLFVAALLALIAFSAVRSASSQAQANAALTEVETKIRLASRWSSLTESTVARSLAAGISTDPAVAAAFKDTNANAISQISELQKQLGQMPQSDADRAQVAKIAELRKAALASSARMTGLREAGKVDDLRAEAMGPFSSAAGVYLQALRDFVSMQEQAAQVTRERLDAERQTTVTIAAVTVGLIVLSALLGTAALVRSITSPVQQAITLADAIAEGDLSQRPEVLRKDEFGDLMRALAGMGDKLSQVLSQVRQASDSIHTASAEIASGNIDLSQRTEQTAGNLQQTAGAIVQLSGTVRQSADSAHTANQLAQSAATVAQRGGSVVAQVISTMDEINTSSKRIADIIGTIDGIAFQTNILALNAAVEAARAGEQGRGFAVVAGEVRSLAQRSAEAAREIKTLIGNSVERVESGSRLVQDAGNTMGEIVSSVQRVTDIIGEISAASTEQSQGIGQVNNAVGTLDQMTQQNAALVEESAAAAESLKDQAQRLAEVVARFRLPGATAAPQTSHHAAARTKPGAMHKAPARAVTPVAKAPAAPAPAKPVRAPQAAARAADKPAPAATSDAAAGQGGGDWESF